MTRIFKRGFSRIFPHRDGIRENPRLKIRVIRVLFEKKKPPGIFTTGDLNGNIGFKKKVSSIEVALQLTHNNI